MRTRSLSKKEQALVRAYATKHKCRAYEVVIVARFVSEDDFPTVMDVARVVSGQFNPAGRRAMGRPLKEKNGKGKFARLPGDVVITDLTAGKS